MKKMRRLIPAIAMLLVSAVMLSTASFAWFTMSTEATAGGMNVQAKADGSLVIDNAPLTFASAKTTIDFATATSKLVPMTWKVIADDLETTQNEAYTGWMVPGNPSIVNSASGKLGKGDALAKHTITADNKATYYLEQEFYIASAGDAQPGEFLTFTLNAPVRSDDTSSLAYTAAIYVITDTTDAAWENDKTVAFDKVPDAFIAVDQNANRNKVTLKGAEIAGEGDTVTYAGYDIPSIVGVGAQDGKTTGIKVIVRIFVDGDLESLEDAEGGIREFVTGFDYEAVEAGKAIESTKYYYYYDEDADKYVPAVTEGYTTTQDGWFIQVPVTEKTTFKYVNSNEVPTAASQLEISVSIAD